MRHNDFPHEVTFQKYLKVSDGAGGSTQEWSDYITIEAFCDTPNSREIFEAQQINNPLDRNLFYEYRTDIDETMRCIFENGIYELVGKPQDQGGAHEVMKVSLRLIRNE